MKSRYMEKVIRSENMTLRLDYLGNGSYKDIFELGFNYTNYASINMPELDIVWLESF